MSLKPVTVSKDLMAKERAYQSFGATYMKERSPSVTLITTFDNLEGDCH